MITQIRSTVRQALAGGVELTKSTFKEFANTLAAQGFTMFSEWLTPKPGKPACMFFRNPGSNLQVIVVLSKSVAALRAAGKLPDDALKTLTVIDGKNAAGEQRYYLSSNGITEITVAEAIAIGERYQAMVTKLSAERLQSLIS